MLNKAWMYVLNKIMSNKLCESVKYVKSELWWMKILACLEVDVMIW